VKTLFRTVKNARVSIIQRNKFSVIQGFKLQTLSNVAAAIFLSPQN
jgi:hypothetical protein